MLEKSVIKHLGNELYEALKNQTPVEPLTTRYPQIGEDDAYKISLQMLNRRIESGEKVVGKKTRCHERCCDGNAECTSTRLRVSHECNDA